MLTVIPVLACVGVGVGVTVGVGESVTVGVGVGVAVAVGVGVGVFVAVGVGVFCRSGIVKLADSLITVLPLFVKNTSTVVTPVGRELMSMLFTVTVPPFCKFRTPEPLLTCDPLIITSYPSTLLGRLGPNVRLRVSSLENGSGLVTVTAVNVMDNTCVAVGVGVGVGVAVAVGVTVAVGVGVGVFVAVGVGGNVCVGVGVGVAGAVAVGAGVGTAPQFVAI